MPTNVFISFQRNDLEYVNSIRALADNRQHELEFHDRSEIQPVTDKNGKPLRYPPHHDGSKPIKNKLKGLLKKATKMVVVIGENTHKSEWVNWEIQSFYDRYEDISGDSDKRILALFVPDKSNYTLPRILTTYSIRPTKWDMNLLSNWINTNPNQGFPILYFPPNY
ncbi:TIR domain-containing protein [Chloroflexota bacterium]